MLTVTGVRRGSPAYRAGIRPGDTVTSIAGERCCDFIDYEYLTAGDCFEIAYNRPSGKSCIKRIVKRDEEDFGISFRESRCRACANNCIFCFVDQLPPGMRETLYFKDDDWRMSFLMGNYVTLTNVGEREFERILRRKTSPLFISVHATDPAVRGSILRSKNADIMPRLRALADSGIYFDCQAVVAPGINDGDILEKTVTDLIGLYPFARSLAIVPVGLTAHRAGLYPLSPVSRENARAMIALADKYSLDCLEKFGTRFVFAADELYMRAELPLPSAACYEELLQKEDGVGLTASFFDEAYSALGEETEASPIHEASLACGTDIAPLFSAFAESIEQRLGLRLHVYPIENIFFGSTVTVSGLMTGQDIIAELKGQALGEKLFISASALRRFEDVFLDGVTLQQLCDILNVNVKAVEPDGFLFIDALMNREETDD